MSIWSEADVGLPLLTNRRDQTKRTIRMGGSDAYQTLPDPVLAERTALVILVWSTNAYHLIDLSLSRPSICFTKHYHRDGGQGIKPDAPFRVGQYRQYRQRGCHVGSRVKGG